MVDDPQAKSSLGRLLPALKAVAPYRKTHRGAGVVKIDCPVCKTGTLCFSIAKVNGHCQAMQYGRLRRVDGTMLLLLVFLAGCAFGSLVTSVAIAMAMI